MMGASGAQGCTGEKGAAAGSPWKLDREDRGRGGGRKIEDELVNPWPCFAACCLLLYTMLLLPHQHVRAREGL